MKIGVIDTGIDYNHPDLKAVYRGGYDFVDGDADPMETTWEDWKASKQAEVSNGSTYYTQHGTHVAGIIAGTGETAGSAQGVAPDAEIYSYRVLGPYGSGRTGGIIAAMDRALADGMDVINMSLGASVNDPLTPQGMAANNLVLAGVTTVVAAGNSGSDSYTLGTPAASALPITVGANDSPIDLAAFTATMGAAEATGRLLAKAYGGEVEALDGASLSVFDGGLGNSAGYAGDTPTGKVALVRRGDITLNQKVEYAKQRGAVAVLVVNQEGTTGHIPSYLGESKKFVPAFSITAEQGASLYAALAAGTATVAFAADGTLSMGDGSLASFSSRGPVSGTVAIKPEITAPGVSVLSSIPVDIVDPEAGDYTHAYASLSGTSMAALRRRRRRPVAAVRRRAHSGGHQGRPHEHRGRAAGRQQRVGGRRRPGRSARRRDRRQQRRRAGHHRPRAARPHASSSSRPARASSTSARSWRARARSAPPRSS